MLTPQDIENKMFKVSFKGYNIDEVDDFLQEVCDSYVALYLENKENREKIARLSEAVGQYKSMEGTLQDALSVADKSTDEIEKDALRKAAEIVSHAELSAECIIAGARQRAEEEEQRLENIKREIELYREKISGLLSAQMNILSGYPASGKIDGSTYKDNAPKKAAKREQITERINLTDRLEMKTEDLTGVAMKINGEFVAAV